MTEQIEFPTGTGGIVLLNRIDRPIDVDFDDSTLSHVLFNGLQVTIERIDVDNFILKIRQDFNWERT